MVPRKFLLAIVLHSAIGYLAYCDNGKSNSPSSSPPQKPSKSSSTKPSIVRDKIPLENNYYIRLKVLVTGDVMVYMYRNKDDKIRNGSKLCLWRHDQSSIVEQKLVFKEKTFQADDIFENAENYIVVDRKYNMTFTFNPQTYQFDAIPIKVTPEKIIIHPQHPNILLINSQKAIYLLNKEDGRWTAVANNVESYVWRNDQTTRLYFTENVGGKKKRLYIANPLVGKPPAQLFAEYNDVVMIEQIESHIIALVSMKSETHMYLIDQTDKPRRMYFPSHTVISEFKVERLLDGHLIISVMKPGKELVASLFGGNLSTLKFVRLIDNISVRMRDGDWHCTDMEFHPVMNHMIFANKLFNHNDTKPTIRTMVSFDLGVRWKVVRVDAVLSENNGQPCDGNLCNLCLLTACSRKRRYSAMTQKYTPHIVISQGVIFLQQTGNHVIGLFISTDYGNSFQLVQRGNHDPYMINGGSVIVSSEIYTNTLTYSLDDGHTFQSLEYPENDTTLVLINFPNTLETRLMVFTYNNDHEIIMNIMDFKDVLKHDCLQEDFIIEFPKIYGAPGCYKGTRYQNYRKKHTSVCKIGQDIALPPLPQKPCHCKAEDFGCSFGFFLKDNLCLMDPENGDIDPMLDSATWCVPGRLFDVVSHYQKVFEDTCEGDSGQKSATVSICKVNSFTDSVVLKVGNALKLFLPSYDYLNLFSNIQLEIPPHENFHSIFFDFNSNCFYYVVSNVGLKSICYGEKQAGRNKSAPATLYIHSPAIFQASFDFIGSNLIILDPRGLYLKSKYKNLEKLIFKNRGKHEITSFKAYSLFGKIVASSPRSKTLFVLNFSGDILYTVEDKSVNGYLMGKANQQLFFWDDEALYSYDPKNNKTKLEKNVEKNKKLIDVVVMNDNLVYFYNELIQSNDHSYLINHLLEVSAGYKYDKYYDYCPDSVCHFMCIPDVEYPKTRCLCPNDAELDGGVCKCVQGKPGCFGCEEHEFSCGDGTCIQDIQVCDGLADCYNRLDETNCQMVCNSETFKCEPLSVCLDLSLRCNKVKDCPDGSDETGCVYPPVCATNEFTCHNSKCLPTDKVCNNVNDCGDHSDESNCKDQVCTHLEFQCKSDGKCVPNSAVCDDVFDCLDMSDEQNCHAINFHTEADCPFRCDINRCIALKKVCDHISDCDDSTDELFCNFLPSCTKGYLPCAYSGHCYTHEEACNGTLDCFDGTDERNCPKTTSCKNPTYFTCVSDRIECIPNHAICDGFQDCKDGSDELDCEPRKIRYINFKHGVSVDGLPFVELLWSVKKQPASYLNSSFEIQLFNSNFRKIHHYETTTHVKNITNLDLCKTYIVRVGYKNTKDHYSNYLIRSFKALGSFVSQKPALLTMNETYISWKNQDGYCKLISFYVECQRKNLTVVKTFTDKESIAIQSGIDTCDIYSCPYPIFNFLCSNPLSVEPEMIRYRRIQIIVAVVFIFLITISVLVTVIIKYKSATRRLLLALFIRRLIPNQRYQRVDDNLDELLESESDVFIN